MTRALAILAALLAVTACTDAPLAPEGSASAHGCTLYVDVTLGQTSIDTVAAVRWPYVRRAP